MQHSSSSSSSLCLRYQPISTMHQARLATVLHNCMLSCYASAGAVDGIIRGCLAVAGCCASRLKARSQQERPASVGSSSADALAVISVSSSVDAVALTNVDTSADAAALISVGSSADAAALISVCSSADAVAVITIIQKVKCPVSALTLALRAAPPTAKVRPGVSGM